MDVWQSFRVRRMTSNYLQVHVCVCVCVYVCVCACACACVRATGCAKNTE